LGCGDLRLLRSFTGGGHSLTSGLGVGAGYPLAHDGERVLFFVLGSVETGEVAAPINSLNAKESKSASIKLLGLISQPIVLKI